MLAAFEMATEGAAKVEFLGTLKDAVAHQPRMARLAYRTGLKAATDGDDAVRDAAGHLLSGILAVRPLMFSAADVRNLLDLEDAMEGYAHRSQAGLTTLVHNMHEHENTADALVPWLTDWCGSPDPLKRDSGLQRLQDINQNFPKHDEHVLPIAMKFLSSDPEDSNRFIALVSIESILLRKPSLVTDDILNILDMQARTDENPEVRADIEEVLHKLSKTHQSRMDTLQPNRRIRSVTARLKKLMAEWTPAQS